MDIIIEGRRKGWEEEDIIIEEQNESTNQYEYQDEQQVSVSISRLERLGEGEWWKYMSARENCAGRMGRGHRHFHLRPDTVWILVDTTEGELKRDESEGIIQHEVSHPMRKSSVCQFRVLHTHSERMTSWTVSSDESRMTVTYHRYDMISTTDRGGYMGVGGVGLDAIVLSVCEVITQTVTRS
ncbi:hypothetical protein Tco_0281934 [Tanacetum coccineum]